MDIEIVKSANRIEDVVSETFTLRGTGRYRRAVEHDSLVVDVAGQAYFWNSRGEAGDVIDWVQARQGCDFKTAVEALCRRAHLEPPVWSAARARQAAIHRQVENALAVGARHFAELLAADEAARAYAEGRGWGTETIRAEGLGYYDGDAAGLRAALRTAGVDLSSPGARALFSIPAGMLIYPHRRGGRVEYLSGRSIEGKRHYNLPRGLAGERRPHFNHLFNPAAASVVVCEGQADAVTWAAWGQPAVALAGCSPDVALVRALGGMQLYLALDRDPAGETGTHALADLAGPLCRVLPAWPDGAVDANEALQAGINAKQARELLAQAHTWVELRAWAAGSAPEPEREQALRAAFAQVRRLDEFQLATMRKKLAEAMDIGLRQFNGLLKAAAEVEERRAAEEDALRMEQRVVSAWVEDHLVESLYIPEEERTRLAVRFPDGRIEIVDELVLPDRKILPVHPLHPALRKSVLLPDAVGSYDSVKALQREVAAFIHRYLDIDLFYKNLAAYYVLFSWMYDSFQVLPYLRARGDYGTGKTRFLVVIGSLCYKPIFVAGATTTSPIFRLLHEFRGTLVLDEADFAASDTTADIIKILNVGFDRTFDVQRTGKTGDGEFVVEFFEVFGPKVIATRKKFEDRALESRCLTYETASIIPRADIPVILPVTFQEEARKLRNKLLRYRLEHWRPAVEVANEDVDRAIEPRLNQVTMSLKKLVDDPGLVEEIDRFIREYQRQAVADRGMTLAAKVLQALVDAHDQPVEVDESTDPPTFIYDLSVNEITRRTNEILDEENQRDAEEDDGDGQSRRKKYELGVKRVGSIIRNELQLKTRRDHSSRQRGRFVVVWDEGRVKALCQRYGVEL